MRTILHLSGSNVFKMSRMKWGLSLLTMVCGLNLSFAQTQTPESKKEADIKRFEATYNTAKAGLAMAEKQAAAADSLLSVGPDMIKEGNATLKEVDAERAAKAKEYKLQTKPLNKRLGSKDKDDATDAKNELKKIDAQFKADMKALDKKEKDAEKKITTGENNKIKGKMNKKTSAEKLKNAQAKFDDAEAKLDAAKGGDEPVKGMDKNKKSKKK
ncbi:MAG: hypothetical protein Q8928_18730 [Bacteroidota bacterium]|nr:hypothetical protein [Bacteroidota bacterium]